MTGVGVHALDYRVVAIIANVLADQLGLPVPAVPTLIVAGALAGAGQVPAAVVFTGAVLACLVADLLWYAAGRAYGNGVMKMLCRISLTPDSCVSQTHTRFERWGPNALIVAKFVPGLGIIAPPLAGATRMGSTRFIVYSALGAAAWVAAAMLAGLVFRPQIERLLPQLSSLGGTAVVVVLGTLLLYIAYKWWERVRFYSVLRMARISVDELYQLMGTGTAPLIVDVRSVTAVNLDPRRIPGALHIPLHDVAGHLKELPRDREVVAYCTCPNEASAAQVARLLMDSGFKRVRPLHGGLEAWVAAGHDVELIQISAGRQESLKENSSYSRAEP